jgi:hypothetical protein
MVKQLFFPASGNSFVGKKWQIKKPTHLVRLETKEVGNHEMCDRQRNEMKGADFTAWAKGCGLDRLPE